MSKMDHETLGGRIPKGERRVRFADSMGMELVSIFLTDLFVLASHTPYTNYNEHRKPPSSRLSSTLQAIQYNNDHHHHHHHQNSSNINNNNDTPHNATNITHNSSKSIISNKPALTTRSNINGIQTDTNTGSSGNNNNSKLVINNNHFNSYHSSTHHAKPAIIASAAAASVAASYHSMQQPYHNHYHNQQLHQHQYHQQHQSTGLNTSPASAAAGPVAQAGATGSAGASQNEYICEFTQPVSLISFKERVKIKKVHLESCYINTTAGHVSLTCNIRVLNVSYDKSVCVRYTTDDWANHTDSLASYRPGSSDGWSDQFTSTISIINKLAPGQRIIFAVKYVTNGTVYWDNNGGLDYSVKNKHPF